MGNLIGAEVAAKNLKTNPNGTVTATAPYNAQQVAGVAANTASGYHGGGYGGGSIAAPSGYNYVQNAQQGGTPTGAPMPTQAPTQQPAAATGTPATSNTAAGEGYGPGFGEKYGMSHVGQYDQPTLLEQFAQQQLNGNNPYYDRLRQQGMDALNQQMAARGHYNSGGALSALGNFSGALGAAQFQDMGNLLGSAGSQGLQRMGQGQTVANNVQQLQLNRLGQQSGMLSDLAHLGAGTVGGFYGQGGSLSGDAAMAGINAGANAAGLTGQGQQAFTNTGIGLGKALFAS